MIKNEERKESDKFQLNLKPTYEVPKSGEISYRELDELIKDDLVPNES